jgi:hypothetical protein
MIKWGHKAIKLSKPTSRVSRQAVKQSSRHVSRPADKLQAVTSADKLQAVKLQVLHAELIYLDRRFIPMYNFRTAT